MTTQPPATLNSAPRGSADILALGFATTIAMWTVGYLSHLPGLQLPSALVLSLLALLLLLGGYLAGKQTPRGWRGGLAVCLLSGLLNLLILGSLLSSPTGGLPHPLLWVTGWLLLNALLGALAGALGAARYDAQRQEPDWTGVFAGAAAVATFVLVILGGLVTSNDAGLAVPDWPSSFGSNMFLFPLARMAGGIYYEHAHRLLGALVGLTTLVLAIYVLASRRGRAPSLVAVLAFLLVCFQGVLGGQRVTEGTAHRLLFGLSDLQLAFLHGVLGQLFFATMCALAVLISRPWLTAGPSRRRPREPSRP